MLGIPTPQKTWGKTAYYKNPTETFEKNKQKQNCRPYGQGRSLPASAHLAMGSGLLFFVSFVVFGKFQEI